MRGAHSGGEGEPAGHMDPPRTQWYCFGHVLLANHQKTLKTAFMQILSRLVLQLVNTVFSPGQTIGEASAIFTPSIIGDGGFSEVEGGGQTRLRLN